MGTVEAITLNNGVEMPAIGYGVFRMDDPADCERAVDEALAAGYRYIDTAAAYLNEEAVGRAIAASGIPRGELFVSTKLWVTDTSYELARPAFMRSLDRLGLDYVDLYLIHQPYNDVYGAWRAMEELVEEGRIRSLGVDNMDSARLADFLRFAGTTPAVDFIQANVGYQRETERAYMTVHGVHMEAWAPLAAGSAGLFGNRTMAGIAAAHGRTVAQVALRWLIQRGITPVVKSANPERMCENLDVFDFALTDEDMTAIAALDTGIDPNDTRDTGDKVDRFLDYALTLRR
ncbi:2,5-diketo-D-gluconic acid reductase [Bifidobacterium primatium]|uniref:2,5-diketo-D-gluconic acid reductase n=1 Tax=Bifidobacterium primatium TaxID=2045438 RepID=A0A2M9H7Z4_9BIFI|nr:aldo/keto reductase [Bifidobacterium primatium]PJM72914.1 2,5-diketo-D-gluconic acid reductase [Bifidobacterium primatium]